MEYAPLSLFEPTIPLTVIQIPKGKYRANMMRYIVGIERNWETPIGACIPESIRNTRFQPLRWGRKMLEALHKLSAATKGKLDIVQVRMSEVTAEGRTFGLAQVGKVCAEFCNSRPTKMEDESIGSQ